LSPANQVLALNIVDWMLADSALLEMRAREFADAPLDADLSDGVRQAVKYGNIIGIPVLLVFVRSDSLAYARSSPTIAQTKPVEV
jgi:hypothetical protein